MYYVYLLKSTKDGKLYIGFTNDLKRRILEHNSGLSKSTKSRRPFKLIYYEAYTSEKDAKQREKMLKRFSGSYTHLKKRVKNSLILFKWGACGLVGKAPPWHGGDQEFESPQVHQPVKWICKANSSRVCPVMSVVPRWRSHFTGRSELYGAECLYNQYKKTFHMKRFFAI